MSSEREHDNERQPTTHPGHHREHQQHEQAQARQDLLLALTHHLGPGGGGHRQRVMRALLLIKELDFPVSHNVNLDGLRLQRAVRLLNSRPGGGRFTLLRRMSSQCSQEVGIRSTAAIMAPSTAIQTADPPTS